MLGVFVGVLAATVHMYGVVPKGFIPDQDNDSMNINIRAAQGTSFYQMSTAAQKVAEVVSEPVHRQLHGPDGRRRQRVRRIPNTAQVQVNLVPRATRQMSAQQISQQLRRQLLSFPNYNVVREPAVGPSISARASGAARTT